MSTTISDIRKWTAASKCPSCKGGLRQQGVVEQSSLEDFIEAGKILLNFAGFFSVAGYVKKAALMWVSAIRTGLKTNSVLRQCKSCGEFAAKCPKCKRIIHAGSKPGSDGYIHTKCPHCELKIAAWLITIEEVEKQKKRQREIAENYKDYDYYD